MADLADTLRTIPLFSALSREDIAKVLGRLEEKTFPAGTTIFSQGDQGDSFYFIQSGAVQVVLETAAGRKENIAVFGPQDCFGEMALLSGEPRSATIIAIKETTVWRLSREAWGELIEKHPTWLLHFCATLSKRLARLDHQYSQGREAFNKLAQEFYSSISPDAQRFFRAASLLNILDPQTADGLLQTSGATGFLADLEKSPFPLMRAVPERKYELRDFFRDFLREKLLETEGDEGTRDLHRRIAAQYEKLGNVQEAISHWLDAREWDRASALLFKHHEDWVDGTALFVKNAVDRIPPDHFFANLHLVHIKADALARLGDIRGALRIYKEVLAQKSIANSNAEAIARYQKMADTLVEKGDTDQALHCLRSALMLAGQEVIDGSASTESGRPEQASPPETADAPRGRLNLWAVFLGLYKKSSFSRWTGGVLGFAVCAYLWFWQPNIGLEPQATKLFGLLCLTLIYWVFWVFPDYGVALLFALSLILANLAKPETVLGGFASTTWFMTLGVLGLGAAITGSGLFYRLSLQLVRFFPLNYYWQIVALGIMGIVVMALIPQQSARTAIISQMLLNLTESLGYKSPSKASTGLFVASFLGLGQLGFLFLTGSTTSLIAWGLLPPDVRDQFTWGYWFLAALPPTLIVTVIIIAGAILLYRPETQARVSYKMVQNQLDVLGPLSRNEWITLAVLIFTIVGWLTVSYHKIDGAWISLISLCVLVNTGVLGWGMIKKGIDWELLIYMGATLSIPALLSQAKIDNWMVGLIAPLVRPFLDSPAMMFIVVILISYALKLFFTSFLTVVALTVALLPLAAEMNMSPWVVAMIVLIGSEVWFFRFQVDWHTLAFSTSEGKGFSYPMMAGINWVYAGAYIVALLAAIPYWRYLGLIG
ncbi:MAG TPA: SLC13 family permease [Candidatus Binatia bacterium]|jgi:anion transporter